MRHDFCLSLVPGPQRSFSESDFGAHSPESVDYADFAHPLAEAIENGELERGVALCGSGEGMTMTLNKHQGIRAGLCWDTEIASLIRRHNDANIIVFPARFITNDEAVKMLDSEEPEMAEAGPLQHVADGIADTLNEGRETDGTKADETETDGTVTDGARN